MADQLSVGLTRPDQVEAFDDVRDLVAQDVDEGVIDADTWGDGVPDGDVVRVLAEAYRGTLDVDSDALGDVAADPDAVPVDDDGQPLVCPECGDDYDVGLGWDRTNDDLPDDFGKLCRHDHSDDDWSGWMFFHGVNEGGQR